MGRVWKQGARSRWRPALRESTNIVVRTTLPTSGLIQGSTVAITVDHSIPKEPIAKRNVPLVYAEAAGSKRAEGRLFAEL